MCLYIRLLYLLNLLIEFTETLKMLYGMFIMVLKRKQIIWLQTLELHY